MKRTITEHNGNEQQGKALVDRKVIEGCQARQKDAFADLYKASLPYVLHIVREYIQCEETHKDLVQEIYSRTFLAIDSYSFNRGPFRFWLRKIAVNQCLMHIRASNRKEQTIELPGDIGQIPEPNGDSPTARLHPEVVRKMLNLMPNGYRTVFTLVVMNGYTHEEAGEELGISTQTSRSQLARGKQWLRNYLKSNKNLVDHG